MSLFPSGNVDMSHSTGKYVVDTVTSDFRIHHLTTTSPNVILSQPQGTIASEHKVKQGIFAEDSTIVVCGSMSNCAFIYDLRNKSPILPSQILTHDGKGSVQTIAVSHEPLQYVAASRLTCS